MSSRPTRRQADTGNNASAILASRTFALDLLHAVLSRRQPLDQAFRSHPLLSVLDRRDLALARNLAATSLRRLGQIDALIDHCLDKPKLGGTHPVRQVLRLGITQLLFLATPPHAALDTSVALARKTRHGSMAGMVNAVLRRLTTEGAPRIAMQDTARLNTPAWLWRSWYDAYGADTCRRIAEQHLCDPPLDISLKDADASALAELPGARRLFNGTIRIVNAGPVGELPDFDAGAWWVQDSAASLPARLLGDIAGKHVVDLCAAPGGKTAQLIIAGAKVTAVDRSPRRMRQLEQNLTRLDLAADLVVADATAWRPAAPVDAVLIDAPCSATGTIRRHPDIAWLKSQRDVDAMAEVQARLLAAAAAIVRPGGTIVYASCSLQPEEGPALVERIDAIAPSLHLSPVRQDVLSGFPDAVAERGWLRTLPHHLAALGGMDGFFAARLVREGY